MVSPEGRLGLEEVTEETVVDEAVVVLVATLSLVSGGEEKMLVVELTDSVAEEVVTFPKSPALEPKIDEEAVLA